MNHSSAWETGIQFGAGFLMAHRPVIAYLQRNHAASVQLYALKKTDGSLPWHIAYGRPSFGIAYRLTDFGNREEIGLGHSVLMMARFPLIPGNSTWQSTLDLGYGLGLIERPFDVESNYKNLSAGSVINAAFSISLSSSYPLSERLRIRGGIDFLHLSNGAARMPNLGLNIPGAHAGFSYRLSPPERPRGLEIRRKLRLQHYIPSAQNASYRPTRGYGAIGFKEIYPPNQGPYPVLAMNIQHHRTKGSKGLFGGGSDFIVDSSLPTKTSRESGEPEPKGLRASIRVGLFGSAGLQMGPWSAYFQTGIYLANPVKSDGDIYNRLALHYQFNKGLFLCMNLKSHFGKADYIEWGAGYSF